MSYPLPILNREAKAMRDDGFSFDKVAVLAVLHPLEDSKEFLICLKELGAHFVQVIGIPYSSDTPIERAKRIQELNDKGIVAIVPEREEDMHEYIEKALRKIICMCKKDNLSFIIVEDGGRATMLFHKLFASDKDILPLCKGVVEQTKSGLWKIMSLLPDKLFLPVFTVSDSQVKEVEGTLVGRSLTRNLDHILTCKGKTLGVMSALIVGYGWIGRSVAHELRGKVSNIMINEIKSVRTLLAIVEGFEVVDKKQGLKSADLIIGATGRTWLRDLDFLLVKDGAFLVNASSGGAEFDLSSLKSLSVEKEKITEHVDKYVLINGKKIYVLYGGKPINFALGKSLPNEFMDLVMTEMLVEARKLVSENLQPGIYRLPEEDETRLVDIWLACYKGINLQAIKE